MQILSYDPNSQNLSGIGILSDLSDPELALTEQQCEWSLYEVGEVILAASEPDSEFSSHDVYFLTNGSVSIVTNNEDGSELTLAQLNSGSQFGELSALDQRGRSANVLALTDCTVARLNRDNFINLLIANSQICMNLLLAFSSIIRQGNEQLFSITTFSNHQRIYLELLKIAEPNPLGDDSWLINIAPRHSTIAYRCGTKKTDVANAIGGLVRNKIIVRENRGFKINNLEKLRMLAGLS
jgi:CRP-like cAMP-binding protein